MRSAVVLVIISLLNSTVSSLYANETVSVQLLGINDFHGNLEPPPGSSGRIGAIDAGGIEYLATHIKKLRARNPNTVVVSAGDLIGASPLISALFHDEPTIEAMNLLGLDFNAVGNHELDDGWTELLRMQSGGCYDPKNCVNSQFPGANFNFLAANIIRDDNSGTLFPAYKIRNFQGAKIAFVGIVLQGAPSIVNPAAIGGLSFANEADTANALIPELKANGVETIVVLIHEGGVSPGGYNECPGISGPIVDIVNRMDPSIDVVISGHTHQAYNCVINGKLVTSAASYGRVITDIDLTIDPASGEMISAKANNLIVTRNVVKDPEETALIANYKRISSPIANRVIGSISTNLTRTTNAAGESILGRTIADAQYEATAPFGLAEADIAFMNPGGIRSDLTFISSEALEGDGKVTYGEIFTIQPFGNSLVTMSLTGNQIHSLLEQQFAGCGLDTNRILQISQGFSYTWKQSAEACEKVDPASMKIRGVTMDAQATYRITVNSFLAEGGDGFSVLKNGTHRQGGVIDVDALEAYFNSHPLVGTDSQYRISMMP